MSLSQDTLLGNSLVGAMWTSGRSCVCLGGFLCTTLLPLLVKVKEEIEKKEKKKERVRNLSFCTVRFELHVVTWKGTWCAYYFLYLLQLKKIFLGLPRLWENWKQLGIDEKRIIQRVTMSMNSRRKKRSYKLVLLTY